MNAAVDTISDPDDDAKLVKYLYRRANRRNDVIVAAMPPFRADEMPRPWPILRALGKRTTGINSNGISDPIRSARATSGLRERVTWHDVEIWMAGYQIRTLVLLHAEYLGYFEQIELERVAANADVHLVLVFSGIDARKIKSTTAPSGVFDRRPADARSREEVRWPAVPCSHPLRFRYDCAQALGPDDFAYVDHVLWDTAHRLHRYLSSGRQIRQRQILRLVSVITAGSDPNQRRTRRRAAALAFLEFGRSLPRSRPAHKSFPPKPVGDTALEEMLRPLDSTAAVARYIQTFARIPTDLIRCIGEDQITATTLLGHKVPKEAQTLLIALRAAGGWTYGSTRSAADCYPSTELENDEQATNWLTTTKTSPVIVHLQRLLNTPRGIVERDALAPSSRARFDMLVADGILSNNTNGDYVATPVALYSSYRRSEFPRGEYQHSRPARPATDKQLQLFTDI